MQSLDSNQLQVIAVQNQYAPGSGQNGGPKVLPVYMDFTLADADGVNSTVSMDLSSIADRGFIDMVQTMFIDASGLQNTLTVLFNGSNQRIVIKPNTQGYYNVLAPNPVKASFKTLAGSGQVQAFLANVAIPGVVWVTQ